MKINPFYIIFSLGLQNSLVCLVYKTVLKWYTEISEVSFVFNKTVEDEEEVNHASKISDQANSDQEKVEDISSFPACIGKTSVPKDPLRNPQLSDFGLSQYAFSRTWDVMDVQSQTNMHKEDSRNGIPAPKQTPYIVPKTPKCTLKMDDYECLTPKLEHFGISEHTMCLNEDYTMALINKNLQTRKK